MTFLKSILLLISVSMIAALVACSSSSSHPATLTLSSVPATLTVNSQTAITATVTNSTATVSWTVTCASTTSACGTFNSTTGTQVTYIAPVSPTTGVVITATLTGTSPAVTAAADTAIAGASLADGNYVFSLGGTDSDNYNGYYVSGAFTIASGAITAGEQDFTDYSFSDLFDQINPTGSSITTSADGNLSITLVTCAAADCTNTDVNIGPGGNGTETINGTILPLSTTGRSFINEFDAWASGSGELDVQNTTAAATAPSGGYAFVLSGWDSRDNPLAVGGIINVNNLPAAGDISGAGSIFDMNDDGTLTQAGAITSPSSVSTPDAFGKVTFTLNPTNATFIRDLTIVGYIVDANHIRLLEGFGDPLGGTEGGVALSQSNGTVTTGGFTEANAAGTYVIGLNGWDPSFDVVQVANQLTLTAGAGVAGFFDFNDLINSTGTAPLVSPDPVSATAYTVDASGAGDVTITNINDGGNISYNAQLYLDGNGHALSISMDATDVVAGVGFVQGPGPFAPSSPFATQVTGWDFNYDGEFDGVGPVAGTGSGNFAGFNDLNWLNLQVAPLEAVNNTLSGTLAPSSNGAAATAGIATGTITGLDVTTCPAFGAAGPCTADAFNYYLYDAAGDNIFIEVDLNQATLGVAAQQ